jgi:hypothetical protein
MAHRGRVVKYCLARAAGCALAATFILTACAMSTGIVPYGPGVFLVSEMRAPVLGGAAEAQRVALGEANDFCAHQGLVFAPVMMGPGGYPYSVSVAWRRATRRSPRHARRLARRARA